MDDAIRYPIGPFEPIHNPTIEQRNDVIYRISTLSATLRTTVQTLSEDQLLVPYRPGGWTLRQVIHHMADNDMNAFLRFKRALTEESPTASTYREDLFAQLSDYEAPIDISLNLLDALHNRFTALLRSMQPPQYRRTFTSPALGLITLDTAAQRFDWHNRHHIAQIASLIKRSSW